MGIACLVISPRLLLYTNRLSAARRELGCTPIRTGVLLAWTTPFAIAGDFLAAAMEAALLRRGWPLLRIRR